MAKNVHEIPHGSHIHIGNRWYEKPLFVGVCFALIVAACFFIAEQTSIKSELASAASDAPVNEVIKIAAVGDSNTEGKGVASDDRDDLSYPAQLQQKLGTQYEVTNFGVGGTTMLEGTDNPYTKQDAYEESLAINPDIVLIMLGTNDVYAPNWDAYEFKMQYIELVNQYKDLPSKPKVYIVTPPALFKDDYGKVLMGSEVIPEVYSIAERTEIEVINIYSELLRHSELVPDEIHPNAEGYGVIAQTVYEKLTK